MSLGLVAYDSSGDSSDESDDEGQTQETTTNTAGRSLVVETRPPPPAAPDLAVKASLPLGTSNNTQGVSGLDTVTRPSQSNSSPEPLPAPESLISDDEDDFLSSNAVSSTIGALKLPTPRHTQSTNGSKSDAGVPITQSLLQGLPPPKPLSLSNEPQKATIDTEDDDVLEDLVKPKAKELEQIEKPQPKKRKLIKIQAPRLMGSDSDDEDSSNKKPATGSEPKRSGLFALLPAPKNAPKKESGRVLVPHTLTQKARDTKPSQVPKPMRNRPVAQPASIPQTTTTAAPRRLVDIDDDDDDMDEAAESTSQDFFSFNTSSEQTSSDITSSYSSISSSSSLSRPLPMQGSQTVDSAMSDLKSQTVGATENLGWSPAENVDQTYSDGADNPASYQESTSVIDPDTSGDAHGLDNMEEEIRRLQGRRERGREEISFIDVSANHKADPLELMKNMTEETNMESHSRKTKDQPSSQEKRKHQITYLAHRAKEREFDLKNQWAMNHATKKQTQSRYGF